MINELFDSQLAVSDSNSAHEVFELFVTDLEESDGYPVFGYSHLSYVRAGGSEIYHGRRYWGIVALGIGGTVSEETEAFRVRQDGVLVLMLGCI